VRVIHLPLLAVALALILSAPGWPRAAPVATPHATIDLVAQTRGVAPGSPDPGASPSWVIR